MARNYKNITGISRTIKSDKPVENYYLKSAQGFFVPEANAHEDCRRVNKQNKAEQQIGADFSK